MFNHWRKKTDDETDESRIQDGKLLIDATIDNNEVEVAALLARGVGPDAPDYNRTLFYNSNNYMTPLHYAAESGYYGCAELLVAHGADPNSKDRFDVTPLHLAARNGHLSCLTLLLGNGAHSNVIVKYTNTKCYPSSSRYVGGSTPLHLAAANNHIPCIVELIHFAADYNAVDENGMTSMHVAASNGHEDCVNTHMDNAMGRHILSLPCKRFGDTPLHSCIKEKLFSSITRLLKHGSDANHANNFNHRPLHLIISHMTSVKTDMQAKYVGMLRDLLTNGYNTDVNLGSGAPEHNGLTPLQVLISKDPRLFDVSARTTSAVLLISYGADFSTVTSKGVSTFLYELRHSTATSDKTIINAIIDCHAQAPRLEKVPFMPLLAAVPDYLSWYVERIADVRSLRHLSRHTIRNALGPHRLRKVPHLNIPTILKDYLLLR